MKKIKIIRHAKCMGLLGVMFVFSNLLSGCANMMQRFGYVPVQSSATKTCAKTPVLITNLIVDAHHRQYQLPDGRQCLEVNYYEQDQLQAKKVMQQWWQ